MRVLARLTFWLAIFFSSMAWATEITLFYDNGTPVWNYDYLVQSIVPGTEVHFGNGISYTVGNNLGSGNMTVVYSLENSADKAIRIPIRSTEDTLNYMNHYIEGYKPMATLPVDVPTLYKYESKQFAIVEKVDMGDSMRDIIRKVRDGEAIVDWDLKLAKMREFSYNTALYNYNVIPDAHLGNVVWNNTKKEFMFSDWGAPIPGFTNAQGEFLRDASYMSNPSIALEHSYFPRTMKDMMDRLVANHGPGYAGSALVEQMKQVIDAGNTERMNAVYNLIQEKDLPFWQHGVEARDQVLRRYDNTIPRTINTTLAVDTVGIRMEAMLLKNLQVGLLSSLPFEAVGLFAQEDLPITSGLTSAVGAAYAVEGLASLLPGLLTQGGHYANGLAMLFRTPPSALTGAAQAFYGASASTANGLAQTSRFMNALLLPMVIINWGVLVGESTYEAMIDPDMPGKLLDFQSNHHLNYSPETAAILNDVGAFIKGNGLSANAESSHLSQIRMKMRSDFGDMVLQSYNHNPTELNAVFLLLADRVMKNSAVKSEDLPYVLEVVQRQYLDFHKIDLSKNSSIKYALTKLGGPFGQGDKALLDVLIADALSQLATVQEGEGANAQTLENVLRKTYEVSREYLAIDSQQKLDAFKTQHPNLSVDETAVQKQIAVAQFVAARGPAMTSTPVANVDSDIIMLAPMVIESTREVGDRLKLGAVNGPLDVVVDKIKTFVKNIFKGFGALLGRNPCTNCYEDFGIPKPIIDPENTDMQQAELYNEAADLEGQALAVGSEYNSCVAYCAMATYNCNVDRGDGVDQKCGPLWDRREELMAQAGILRDQAASMNNNDSLGGGGVFIDPGLNATQVEWAAASDEDATYGQILGAVDGITPAGLVTGWACAKYSPISVKIKLIVGTTAQIETDEVYANVANEAGVSEACHSLSTFHRFTFQIPSNLVSQYAGQMMWVKATSMADSSKMGSLPNASGGALYVPGAAPSNRWIVTGSSGSATSYCQTNPAPTGACTLNETRQVVISCAQMYPGMYQKVTLNFQCVQ